MKILQINSIYINGSTGRTTHEVEKALIEKGHDAYIAYGYGEKINDEHHIRINNKLTNNIHKVMSRLTGLEGYFSFFPTLRLIRFIKKISPDIIHLRCLHGDYINLPLLFSYLKNYNGQIFMNLHDCWDFTGHCSYFGMCNKWKSECHECDKYKLYPKSLFFDTSKRMYRDKKKWYSSLKTVKVIAVSRWLRDLAKESIMKQHEVTYLYNWINQEVFSSNKRSVKSDLNKFSVVFVSASWEPGSYRYQMLHQLLDKMPEEYNVKIVGIYVGERNNRKNTEYVGYVGDVNQLAKIYANSNVYVHLSKEEAFGKVIAEANACGIPSIVFDISGCAEVVSTDSGYKVGVDDIDGIIYALKEIRKNGYELYREASIENVQENFNYRKNVSKLIQLYESCKDN